METLTASELATRVAVRHGMSRRRAFDLVLGVCQDLELPAHTTHYSMQLADEIAQVIAHDLAMGKAAEIVRPTIPGK